MPAPAISASTARQRAASQVSSTIALCPAITDISAASGSSASNAAASAICVSTGSSAPMSRMPVTPFNR